MHTRSVFFITILNILKTAKSGELENAFLDFENLLSELEGDDYNEIEDSIDNSKDNSIFEEQGSIFDESSVFEEGSIFNDVPILEDGSIFDEINSKVPIVSNEQNFWQINENTQNKYSPPSHLTTNLPQILTTNPTTPQSHIIIAKITTRPPSPRPTTTPKHVATDRPPFQNSANSLSQARQRQIMSSLLQTDGYLNTDKFRCRILYETLIASNFPDDVIIEITKECYKVAGLKVPKFSPRRDRVRLVTTT